MQNKVCDKCGRECETPCEAIQSLYKYYDDLRIEEKTEIISRLRQDLDIVDCEVAEDLQELGEQVINTMPELGIIKDFDIKIGYVRSYEAKRDKGRTVFADCRKVRGTYTAYLPFDFIITFYDPNVYHMSKNQRQILMLHELRHIGIGERGLRIENHDVEDFRDILLRFGIDWNGFDQEVPDILGVKVGGDDGRGKGTKGHKLETKRKTNSDG